MKAALLVLALTAICYGQEQEVTLSQNDASLVSSCSTTLSGLMQKKADLLSSLEAIAENQFGKAAEAEKKDDAKATTDGAAAPVELGESDVHYTKKDVENLWHQAKEIQDSLQELSFKFAPQVEELGESNAPREMPVSNEDKAKMDVESKPAEKPWPAAVRLPPSTDHTKDIIDMCVSNVQKTALEMNGIVGYSGCLSKTKEMQGRNGVWEWPNVAQCAHMKPPSVKAPDVKQVSAPK